MRTALITGATGFIGRNLIKRLLQEKIHIYAIVLPTESLQDFCNENVTIIQCDLEKNRIDFSSIAKGTIDVMYHFAWIGVNPESRKMLDIQKRNLDILFNVLHSSRDIGVRKIVFPGSTNEYLYSGSLINSKCIPSPRDAYGSIKVACRYIAQQFAIDNNISFIYSVVSSIYSEQRKDSNVITYTIEKLLKGEKPLLTKLEQKWDYVHIDDVLEAFYLIGERGKNMSFYVIGHGDNWALSNYIKIIHKKINNDIPLGIGEIPYSFNELPCSCVDLTDLKRDTGFVPKIDFEDGIEKVISKMRSYS